MWKGTACLLAVAVLACDGAGDRSEVAGAPEIRVELVGEGVISTEHPEFAASFSPGGDTIYFNRTPPDRSTLQLFFSSSVDGVWSTPQLFPATEGEAAVDPFVSLDGRRLYFSSNRPRDDSATPSFSLWYVERMETGWTEPRDLGGLINSDSSDVFNSLAADGTMVFSSRRSGTRRIYSTIWTESGWSEPQPLSFGDVDAASNPAISPDGTFIVISTSSPGSAPDLFVACRSGSEWGAPHRLPEPVNSEYAEFAPGISGDVLYFTSERPGVVGPQPDSVRPPGDIYRTPLSVASRMCAGA